MLYEHTGEGGKVDERVETVYDSPNDQRLAELAGDKESDWKAVDSWTTDKQPPPPPPPSNEPPAGEINTAKGGGTK